MATFIIVYDFCDWPFSVFQSCMAVEYPTKNRHELFVYRQPLLWFRIWTRRLEDPAEEVRGRAVISLVCKLIIFLK